MARNIEEYKDGIVWIDVDNGLNLKARFTNYGAGLYNLFLKDMRLTLTVENPDEYLNAAQFFGKTLGPVAGRMYYKGELDGKPYNLIPTPESANFSLHGGNKNSISFKRWNYRVKESALKTSVIFKIKVKDGTNGFPGDAAISVVYEFSHRDDTMKIIFKGKTSSSTFFNLSNHIYRNFNNDLEVGDYILKMNCPRYDVPETNLLLRSHDKVPFYLDFQRATAIKKNIDYIERKLPIGTIDHTFLFDGKGNVSLRSKDVSLKLLTDLPAMNIYVDNSMTDVKFINRKDFTKRRGIALEPQLDILDKPSITLRKGEIYNHYILYRFRDLREE
jgi:galactose mutarotase-like enzyme